MDNFLNCTVYRSLQNKIYTSKKDLMKLLRWNINDLISSNNDSTFVKDLLYYYVDCIESKLTDPSDLIEYPAEAFSQLAQKIGLFESGFDIKNVPKFNIENSCFAVKKAFEDVGVAYDIDRIRKIMQKSVEVVPMKGNEYFYVSIFSIFAFLLFRINYLYRNLNSISIVNLRCEGKNYKVNGLELLKTLKKHKMDASGIEEEVNQMTEEGTFDFKELFGKLDKEVMKQIEFVKVSFEQELSVGTKSGRVAEKSTQQETDVNSESGATMSPSGSATPSISEQSPSSATPEGSTKSSEITSQFNDGTLESGQSTQESTESSNQMDSTDSSKIVPKKKKKAKKTKKVLEPEIQKPTESNTCPKCYRSSEFTRKTNEKLRLSKIENKQLKKELTKIQLENEEKEETIRMLKEKLEEQEMKLQKVKEEKEEIKKELEEKKVTIEVMEAEKECVQATTTVDVNVESQSTSTQTTPICSSSFSSETVPEEVKDTIFKLLTIRNTLQIEKPIQKSEDLVNQLSGAVKIGSVKNIAEEEKTAFQKSCNSFIEAVNSRINQLISNPSTIPKPIPEFPTFSKKFQHVFKMTIGSECPPICESLLVIEDPECLICLIDILEKDETVKCGRCTKKYHVECAREWFKVKRTCPTCREGMVDDNEFPSLS